VDARDLLIANLDLLDRVIAFTCRRSRLDPSESEEFSSVVKLKLVDHDYAVIRKFEGRSSFATFLSVVVQRMLLDYRIHIWGKWHPSAEAKRMGELAMHLERLLTRDGRTLDEAWTALRATDPSLTRDALQTIADRLPERAPKKRLVELDEAAAVATSPESPRRDAQRTSEKISALVNKYVGSLEGDDRLILQLRFESDMTVAQIARSMHVDQKQLYRRIEKHLRELRREFESNGIAAADAADLIGNQGVVLDFRLGSDGPRPSINIDNAPPTEELSR
jgi:RNA polymerase sigma factor for flagellar operon FliA